VFVKCGSGAKDDVGQIWDDDLECLVTNEVTTTTWNLWSCQTCFMPMLEESAEWSQVMTQRRPSDADGPAFGERYNSEDLGTSIVYPSQKVPRPPCPNEVPQAIAEDYNEACLVVADSPKASAALSRRCLQHLLRDVAKVQSGDLAREIQQVLDKNDLPSHIAQAIDAIRNVGNFAAHPTKSQRSGEIVTVEPEEAEWNLEVLEALFDFYYVQPAIQRKRINALNSKLADIGKKMR